MTNPWCPPLEGCMSQPRGCRFRAPNESLRRTIPWGTQWGQLDGTQGTRCSNMLRLFSLGVEVNGGFQCPPPSFRLTTLASLLSWGWRSSGSPNPLTRVLGFAGSKIVTWLILPVVICLSQRLSHACLSISKLYGETANGSLNQLSFI